VYPSGSPSQQAGSREEDSFRRPGLTYKILDGAIR
jgi:hypothetical protein